MNLIEKIRLIERVDALIRRKATGSPRRLSDRLNISERSLYNLINLMKEMEAPIAYCRTNESFYYEHDVEFSIGFVQSCRHVKKLVGGVKKSYNDFFSEKNLQRELVI